MYKGLSGTMDLLDAPHQALKNMSSKTEREI